MFQNASAEVDYKVADGSSCNAVKRLFFHAPSTLTAGRHCTTLECRFPGGPMVLKVSYATPETTWPGHSPQAPPWAISLAESGTVGEALAAWQAPSRQP